MPLAVSQRPLRGPTALVVVLAGALALGLTLGGCTQPAPKPIPSDGPSAAEPVFASDEEALAAAEEAYALYQDTWNTIAMEGGADPERMLPFVHPDNQAETLEGLAKFTDRGVHSSGEILVYDVRLQSYEDASNGLAVVSVYACLDLRDSRIIDASGADATPPDRLDQVPGQIRFVSGLESPKVLVFGGDSPWEGENFCL